MLGFMSKVRSKQGRGMWIVFICVAVALLASLLLNAWLIGEFQKKFHQEKEFAISANTVFFHYQAGPKPLGMQNFLITSTHPFVVKVGFEFQVWGSSLGFDPFAVAKSELKPGGEYQAVVQAYLGSGSAKFYFTSTSPGHLNVRLAEEDEKLVPTTIAKPHTIQTMGW